MQSKKRRRVVGDPNLRFVIIVDIWGQEGIAIEEIEVVEEELEVESCIEVASPLARRSMRIRESNKRKRYIEE